MLLKVMIKKMILLNKLKMIKFKKLKKMIKLMKLKKLKKLIKLRNNIKINYNNNRLKNYYLILVKVDNKN